ncbi:MAG: histidine phosphatase family protein [Candidatus Binataceae bacterium]|nr:histidine phosphatase family protein [Candidatus Binataceae bacterium]
MALGPFYVEQKLRTATVHGTVLLMRHGETEWNREGRVMGRNPVELNAAGRAQVAAAADFMREIKLDLIVTSPLVRARQSAETVAERLGGVQVIEDGRLAEVEYGRWESLTFKDLLQDPLYLQYKENPVTMATPGGETIAQAQARGVAAVHDTMEANHSRHVLFVSHGDIIRTVICHYLRLELPHFRRLRIDNANLSALELADNFAEMKFINLLADPARAFVPPFRA